MIPNRASSFLTEEQLRDKMALIIGCGSVGGQAAITLARMGCQRFYLIDNGEVEEVNVGPQPYDTAEIGQEKVVSLMQMIHNFDVARHSNIVREDDPDSIQQEEVQINRYYGDAEDAPLDRIASDPDLYANTFIVLAVDSMHARKDIVRKLASLGVSGPIIDTRMGLQELWITSNVGKEEQAGYPNTLPSDDETEEAPCTEKAISYTPMISAGWIGRMFAAWCRGEEIPREIHVNIREWNHWCVWRSQGGVKVKLGMAPDKKLEAAGE